MCSFKDTVCETLQKGSQLRLIGIPSETTFRTESGKPLSHNLSPFNTPQSKCYNCFDQ